LDYIIGAVEHEKMSEAEVYSNFWILFIAGHDTTATALTWELQMVTEIGKPVLTK
jgi:cytochrome P450